MRRLVPKTTLHLVFIAAFWRNLDRFRRDVEALAEGFQITVNFWRAYEFIDLPDEPTRYDSLWPLASARDATVDDYLKSPHFWAGHRERYLFRPEGVPHEDRLFSSATARDVVEQAFLRVGARLVLQSHLPNPYQRPLGYEQASSLGFGAFFVTYRNCPNNCPLTLWWGAQDRWYPLFPRKTNEETASISR